MRETDRYVYIKMIFQVMENFGKEIGNECHHLNYM